MRKGQITFFVMVGLILAVLLVSFFMFKESVVEQASKLGITKGLVITEEAQQVKSDTTSCMKNLVQDSLILLGLQGGYLNLKNVPHGQIPIDYIGYDGTAYLYYEGKNRMPSLTHIQTELANSLIEDAVTCEKEYKGIDVTYGRVIPKIKIEEDKLKFDINWAIDVQKEETKSTIKNLRFETPVRLGKIRDVVNKIANEQTNEICLSCLAEIGFENNIFIDIDQIDGDIFYLITDEKSKIDNENYMFLMANKF